MQILRQAVDRSASANVFPGRMAGAMSPETLTRVARRVDPGGKWTMHDLRRAMTSRLVPLGISAEISDRATNHITGRGIGQEVYNLHSYWSEKADVFAKWERHLLTIVGEATPSRPADAQAYWSG